MYICSVSKFICTARRGKAPLPGYVKYSSLTFFSLAGAYIGCASAGSLYVKRLLSVPNSRIADDLRTYMGDWSARLPNEFENFDPEPHAPLPDPNNPGSGADVVPPPPPSRSSQRRKQNVQEQKSWTDVIGLTKR